jgi:hypothetical protein
MKKLAIPCLALISLAALLCTSCASTRQSSTAMAASCAFSKAGTQRYQVLIKTSRGSVTGVGVFRFADNEWRGSLLNEFGIKIFDVVAKNNECELLRPIAMLNRWYIRRTIEDDFAFLFWHPALSTTRKILQCLPNGVLKLTNEKRNIEYMFQPITNEADK